MKYMQWSWSDYCEAPGEVIVEVIDMIQEEAAEMERTRSS